MTDFLENFSRETMAYLPSKVIPAILNFASVIIFTKLLTSNQYGNYILVITTVGIFMVFLVSWLKQSLLRYYEKMGNAETIKLFLSTIINTYLLLSLLVFIFSIIVIFLAGEKSPDYLAYLPAIAIIVCLNGLFSLMRGLRRLETDVIHYSFIVCLKSSGQLIIGSILIIYTRLGVMAILIGIMSTSLLILLYEFYVLMSENKYGLFPYSTNYLKKSIIFGVPFIGSQLSNKTLRLADNYIISFYIGSSAVGTYGAGYRVFTPIILMLFSLISLASYPRIVRIYENGGDAGEAISSTIHMFLFISIPACAGLMAIGPELVPIIFDSNYYGVVDIIPWVVLGSLFYGLAQLCSYPLQLVEETDKILFIIAASALLNVVVNIALVPTYGIEGAAMVTFVSFFSYFSMSYIIGTKNIPWEWNIKDITKYLTSTIFMTGLIKAVSIFIGGYLYLFGSVVLGVLSYVICLYLLGSKEGKKIVGILSNYGL